MQHHAALLALTLIGAINGFAEAMLGMMKSRKRQ